MISTINLHTFVISYRINFVCNATADSAKACHERKKVEDILSKVTYGLGYIDKSEV